MSLWPLCTWCCKSYVFGSADVISHESDFGLDMTGIDTEAATFTQQRTTQGSSYPTRTGGVSRRAAAATGNFERGPPSSRTTKVESASGDPRRPEAVAVSLATAAPPETSPLNLDAVEADAEVPSAAAAAAKDASQAAKKKQARFQQREKLLGAPLDLDDIEADVEAAGSAPPTSLALEGACTKEPAVAISTTDTEEAPAPASGDEDEAPPARGPISPEESQRNRDLGRWAAEEVAGEEDEDALRRMQDELDL